MRDNPLDQRRTQSECTHEYSEHRKERAAGTVPSRRALVASKSMTPMTPSFAATSMVLADLNPFFDDLDQMDEEETTSIDDPLLSRKRAKPLWQQVVKGFVCTTAWWMCTIVIVMTIKKTVKKGGIYPYPLCFTAIAQPLTGALAGIVSLLAFRRKPDVLAWTLQEVGIIFALGSMQGIEQGLTNTALKYLTVASRTMISSTSVFFMMCTARIWGLETFDILRVLSAACMIAGGYMQSQDHQGAGQDDTLTGMFLQVAAMLVSANRWALTQHLMHNVEPDSALGSLKKLQLLALCLPINGLVLFPISATVQSDGLEPDHLFRLDLMKNMLIVAGALMIMLYAEMKLIKLLSAVAFQVMSTVHQIPIVLAGVFINGDVVGRNGSLGFSCCLVGALIYGIARTRDGGGGH